ncbi:hypothetical protein O5O45_11470 [Hahella aquimaris]|uniref:hypothetical protein n=1 Tax=Hahella sp. HNIBRBA332 TaxID=3015983 RepID=UPI00273BEF58|nr:hypothetical protein [Hahella sp. HNIBRBA332]WLQ16539.1 hypothetical protein O5O45_11470 [Hahella sp. HNIBRBA332]
MKENDKALQRQVANCLAVTDNPFSQSARSSQEETIKAMTALLQHTDSDRVLAALNAEKERLELLLEHKPGSMTAAEIAMQDKERLWNCRAAIAWIEKRIT